MTESVTGGNDPSSILRWKTTRRVSTKDIKKAWEAVGRVIDGSRTIDGTARVDIPMIVTSAGMASIYFDVPEEPRKESDSSVYFDSSLHFGYPTQSTVESMTPTHRRLYEAQGTDNWLNPNGEGSGSFDTNFLLVDFPLRLFLSVLCSERALEVTGHDGVKFTSGFAVPDDLEAFKWNPLWEETLRPAVEKHWLRKGQTNKLITPEGAIFSYVPESTDGYDYTW